MRTEMGFVGSLIGIIGFGIGAPIGLLLGFIFFIYLQPRNVTEPVISRSLQECLESDSAIDLLLQLPLWVMQPDYEKVDWMNKFIRYIWPYLDKAVCGIIETTMKPYLAEYATMFNLNSIDFEVLSLGTHPPTIEGVKVHESSENELVSELSLKWAANPNIVVVLKLLSAKVTVQLIDVQISAALRVILKPLVPTFPCFSTIIVSLMKKPEVDFGLKVMGGDIMSIPGVYHFTQEMISREVAKLYLWPKLLHIPVLDSSQGEVVKPVGILRVKVLKACKLTKKDVLGASDPYVQLGLSGQNIKAKKTLVKKNTLNPEWNEEFKLTVKDPQSQFLELHLYDWEKIGVHHKLGMQVVALKSLTPYEKKRLELDLLHSMNPKDPRSKKARGQITLEITFVPFLEDSKRFRVLNHFGDSGREIRDEVPPKTDLSGAGMLLITVISAHEVEGRKHTNPYVLILFKGEKRKTKCIRNERNPTWNEAFEFVLEEAPLNEQIHVAILSKPRGIGLINSTSKEALGHVDINLGDVVYNDNMHEKYNLINSKNGTVHLELQWKAI